MSSNNVLFTIPTSEFVQTESLVTLFKAAGFHIDSNTVSYGLSFLKTAENLSKTARVTLYVIDPSPEQPNVVINGNGGSDGIIIVIKNPHNLEVINQLPDPSPTFTQYETGLSINLEELESDDGEEEERWDERIQIDFKASGWFFKEYLDPDQALLNSSNVVTHRLSLQPEEVKDWDLIIKIPLTRYTKGGPFSGRSDVFYVCAFSSNSKIRFHKCRFYEYSSLLLIPDGLGICLLNKATDLIVLDRECVPITTLSVYEEIGFLVGHLESEDLPLMVMSNPLCGSIKDLVNQTVDTDFKDITASSIQNGECVYVYKDSNDIPYTAPFSKLIETYTKVMRNLVTVEPSKLYIRTTSVEKMLSVIQSYLPKQKSILFSVIRKFVLFLYNIGYTKVIPGSTDKDLNESFITYINVVQINRFLRKNDGTGVVDMSQFQGFGSKSSLIYLTEWIEDKSGIQYMKNQ